MEQSTKARLLILLFCAFYFSFGTWNFLNYGEVNATQDFTFHWNRVNGVDSNPEYPGLYHVIFSFFSLNQLFFYAANLLMVAVLIPHLLFRLVKNWWVVAIYFCGVSLFHQVLYSAVYPQALILVLFLIYLLNRKNYWLLASLTIISYLVHGKGIILFAAIWAFELIALRFKPGPTWFLQGILLPAKIKEFKDLILLLLSQLPGPIIFFGFKKLTWFYRFLVSISILACFYDFRVIAIAQLIFTICAAQNIENYSRKIKIGFALFLIAQLVFYLLEFAWGTLKFISLN